MCLVDILFWLPSTPAVALVSPVGLSEPSSLPRTSVTESSSVDDMVRWQFEICLVDIICWPDFGVVSLRKTPAKFSFPPSPVAPVSNIQEAPEVIPSSMTSTVASLSNSSQRTKYKS
jgi:hypothetical protein